MIRRHHVAALVDSLASFFVSILALLAVPGTVLHSLVVFVSSYLVFHSTPLFTLLLFAWRDVRCSAEQNDKTSRATGGGVHVGNAQGVIKQETAHVFFTRAGMKVMLEAPSGGCARPCF